MKKTIPAPSTQGAAAAAANFSTRGACTSGFNPYVCNVFHYERGDEVRRPYAAGFFYSRATSHRVPTPVGTLNGRPASFKVEDNGKAGLFCFPTRKQTYCTTH